MLPISFTTDTRHSVYFQLQDGRFTLLGNSNPYVHCRDRALVVDEFCYNMGWGSDINLSNIHVPYNGLEPYGS